MTKQFTLGKHERIKSRKLIEQLFREGATVTVYPFRVSYFLQPNPNPSSPALVFGIGVSSRRFKKAVARNRIKRLAREAFRLQKLPLQQQLQRNAYQLSLFLIYTGKEMPDFEEVSGKTEVILNRFSKMLHEVVSPNA